MHLDKEEFLHHILPASASTGVMVTLGEHFLFSVAVGVTVYAITHGLTSLFKRLFICK